MKNRQLFFYDPMRSIPYTHICSYDEIKVEGRFSINDIIVKSSEIALNKTIEIFEKFNMERPPVELFKEQQKTLLGKRL